MSSPCDTCKIRKGCDWLSELCQLTPREVVTFRIDLRTVTEFKVRENLLSPESRAKSVATKKRQRRERMKAALEARLKRLPKRREMVREFYVSTNDSSPLDRLPNDGM